MTAHDVRMQGFTRRHTVQQALQWLDAKLHTLDAETVPLTAAAGRVLATAIISNVDVPGFDRATMDGYAVVAESTEGATPYNRVPLKVVGDALPGQPFTHAIVRGEAVRIMTGAPIPAGSDAVLPAESVDTHPTGRGESLDSPRSSDSPRSLDSPAPSGSPTTVAAVAEVSPQKNVGHRGEDILRTTTLLDAGRVLRPQDIGVISSIGVADVSVVRKPQVRLVVTGNELLPAGSKPRDYQIADANGPMLAALVERDGGIVDFPGLVRDDEAEITNALGVGPVLSDRPQADIIIVSGGSSVGIEDLAPMLVAKHGELAVHGIAMRPSSPTGIGTINSRLVFLLPGNPVSALCAYDFFAGRAIRALGGRAKQWPYRAVRGTLTRKISSPIGRLDYARVRIAHGRVEPLSVAGASVLSSTTRADGFVIVDQDSEGYAADSDVEVWLYA